jgi:Cu2+-exporting ATPase
MSTAAQPAPDTLPSMQETPHPLDDPRQWEDFSRPAAGRDGWRETYLAIEGMYCPACSLVVEDALSRLPGVDRVRVNGATQTVAIAWSPDLTRPSRWLASLARAGYGAVPAPDLLTAEPRQRSQRILLWRWLVAGFCMMQVMMYAVPAYVAQPGDITPDIASLLAWASWVLTLPVVLFSCRPFFSAAWRDLRLRRIGMDVPVALGVAIAFAASTAATFDPTGPLGGEVWYDSVTMFVFFLLSGRLLEQRLRDRTAGSLEALMRKLPQTVERQRAGGSFERVGVRHLRDGDTVRVLPGECMPADGVVILGSTQVDEALLTGESTPLARGAGDAVIAGSQNLGGVVTVRVTRTGTRTRYAEIVALMERASLEKPRIAQVADRVAGPFLLGVILCAAVAAMWWWPVDPARALSVAVAVLIVTCPCALSLATPAATLTAAGALARQGVLVRNMQALEACAAIDTVVFDKTGTLTQSRMALASARWREGLTEAEALSLAAALARHSLHPASRAIVAAAGAADRAVHGISEVPGHGVRGMVPGLGGRPGRVLSLGSAAFCGVAQDAAAQGVQVHLADGDGWLASFELQEALRLDAAATVAALDREGMEVQLLSGDRNRSALALGRRLGIAHAVGDRTPQDKLANLRSMQRSGRRVAMVGDGVNDAPVLAAADVSIAMGHGVPLAQAQCDFIVQGEQLAPVVALLRHARRVRSVVRQNLAWAGGYNLVCVPLAALGAMPPWLAGLGMAASSLLVVANSARLATLKVQA